MNNGKPTLKTNKMLSGKKQINKQTQHNELKFINSQAVKNSPNIADSSVFMDTLMQKQRYPHRRGQSEFL